MIDVSTIFLLRNYCFHLNKNVISAGQNNQQSTTFDCSVVFIGTTVRQNTHSPLHSLLVQNKRSTCDDAGPNFKAPIYGCQGNMCTILRGERENPFRESSNHDNCRRIFLTAHESRDERIVVGNTRVPKFTTRTEIDSANVHRNLFRSISVLKEEKDYYIILWFISSKISNCPDTLKIQGGKLLTFTKCENYWLGSPIVLSAWRQSTYIFNVASHR